MNNKKHKTKGFTIVELIIVIMIFAIIFSATSIVFADMIGKYGINNEAIKLVQILRETRMNSVSQLDGSKWGIELVDYAEPHCYIMFKGESYPSRDPAADVVFTLPRSININNISLGGDNEIVFDERSGYTNNSGSFSLSNKDKQIGFTINDLGLVDYSYD